ncbi:MAG: hypothetical protein ACREB3_17055, partial [Burkholderiales bacterium]
MRRFDWQQFNAKPVVEDVQAEIKKKYGLDESVDLTKGFFHQFPRKVPDPYVFSDAVAEYRERTEPPPKKGFMAGAARQGVRILKALTDTSQGGAWGVVPPGTALQEYAAGIREYGTAGAVPILGPMAAGVARTAKTDPSGAAGEAAVDVLTLAIPFLLGRAPRIASRLGSRLDVRRQTLGVREITKAANPPPTVYEGFLADLELVKSDVAAIGREAELKTGGNARVSELGALTNARAEKLWNEGHKPMVARHAEAPVSNQPILERALAEISAEDRQAAPGAARAAESW